MAETPSATFEEFWLHFVRAHQKPLNRWLHVAGIFGALGIAGYALARRRRRLLWLAPAVRFGLGWTGHLVEGNRPVGGFRHPIWSLRADLRLVKKTLAGTMDAEVARAVAAAASADEPRRSPESATPDAAHDPHSVN